MSALSVEVSNLQASPQRRVLVHRKTKQPRLGQNTLNPVTATFNPFTGMLTCEAPPHPSLGALGDAIGYKQASLIAQDALVEEMGPIMEGANPSKRAIDDACLYAREAIAMPRVQVDMSTRIAE